MSLECQPYRPLSSQSVAVQVASNATATAVSEGIHVIRLVSDVDCHVRFGKAPTAVATDMFLKAATPEHFAIQSGEKVAVIRDVGDGTLYVTEMTR